MEGWKKGDGSTEREGGGGREREKGRYLGTPFWWSDEICCQVPLSGTSLGLTTTPVRLCIATIKDSSCGFLTGYQSHYKTNKFKFLVEKDRSTFPFSFLTDNELVKEEKKRENECRIWKRICLEKQRYEREKGKEDKGKDGNDPDDAEKLNETKKKRLWQRRKKERKKVDRKFIPRINETKSFVLHLGQVKC
ncbi:hypothetical protein RUM44_010219 [Polyplax serrata]|uniref:Uncharacterized protein n=1 Tax=Polyplax serrata TaxID=468196 RepID=A0ABR1AUZ7_POLSC